MRRIRFHSPDCTSRDASELSSASSGRADGAVPLTPFGAVEVAPAFDVDAMGANADMTQEGSTDAERKAPTRREQVGRSLRCRGGARESGRQASTAARVTDAQSPRRSERAREREP